MDLPDPDRQGSGEPTPSKRSRAKWIVLAVIAVLLLVGGGTFAAVSIKNAREEARAAELAAEAAADEAAAAEKESAAAEQAEAEEREAEEAAQRAELGRREEAISDIEDSIEEMAEGHVEEGLIDGPVLEVTCSPVAGGSLEGPVTADDRLRMLRGDRGGLERAVLGLPLQRDDELDHWQIHLRFGAP